RPKIHRLLDDYLVPLTSTRPRRQAREGVRDSLLPRAPLSHLLDALPLDRSVSPSSLFQGGAREGRKRLRSFIENDLVVYGDQRNDPSVERGSGLSPYLHFGQIGPLEVALTVREAPGIPEKAKEAFLEEMIVRRELSANFVFYNPRYDTYEGALPAWSRATLEKHRHDPRPYLYGLQELENAATHDLYWNAAQEEMVKTGRMHNYMRMYWGKKIIEWSASPEEAWDTALYLNNRYELDGRDPNAFAGIAWCFGKHDRPWAERPVFGQVRYMNQKGLDRKFCMKAYLSRVASL
ncbi:MAG TPA: deoxyribodipyrimidine photolyase, partial [Synergistales bacterium]|nr:deoxyribodipyrimidine photolyase [Synergistales bacterium]